MARLDEIKVKSLNPEKVRNNLIWMHGLFDSSKSFENLAASTELRNLTN